MSATLLPVETNSFGGDQWNLGKRQAVCRVFTRVAEPQQQVYPNRRTGKPGSHVLPTTSACHCSPRRTVNRFT